MGSRAGAIGARGVETLATMSNCLNLLPEPTRQRFPSDLHMCALWLACIHEKTRGRGRRKRKKRESKQINAIFKVGYIFSPNSSNKHC